MSFFGLNKIPGLSKLMSAKYNPEWTNEMYINDPDLQHQISIESKIVTQTLGILIESGRYWHKVVSKANDVAMLEVIYNYHKYYYLLNHKLKLSLYKEGDRLISTTSGTNVLLLDKPDEAKRTDIVLSNGKFALENRPVNLIFETVDLDKYFKDIDSKYLLDDVFHYGYDYYKCKVTLPEGFEDILLVDTSHPSRVYVEGKEPSVNYYSSHKIRRCCFKAYYHPEEKAIYTNCPDLVLDCIKAVMKEKVKHSEYDRSYLKQVVKLDRVDQTSLANTLQKMEMYTKEFETLTKVLKGL